MPAPAIAPMPNATTIETMLDSFILILLVVKYHLDLVDDVAIAVEVQPDVGLITLEEGLLDGVVAVDTEVDEGIDVGIGRVVNPTSKLTNLSTTHADGVKSLVQEQISTSLEFLHAGTLSLQQGDTDDFRVFLPSSRSVVLIEQEAVRVIGLAVMLFAFDGSVVAILIGSGYINDLNDSLNFLLDVITKALRYTSLVLLKCLGDSSVSRNRSTVTLLHDDVGANHATKATTNEQNGRSVELENLDSSLNIYDDNITVGIVFSVNRTLRNLEGTILSTMNHLEGLVSLLHNRRNLQSSLACGN